MSSSADSYKIKRVAFLGERRVPIFLQNINGPCPLLGIANVLSLRNQLQVSSNATEITQSQLIALVAERYLDANKLPNDNTEWAVNLRQNLDDGLAVLHKLATGIDVNVKFHTITGFEATRELVIFDLLDIRLVHGWLVDPQDRPTASAFADRSYNQLVELLISQMPPGLRSSNSFRRSSETASTAMPATATTSKVNEDLDEVDKLIAEMVDAIALEHHEDPGTTALSACYPGLVASPELPVTAPQPPMPEQPPASRSADESSTSLQSLLINNFLEDNCQQLTVFGLSKLMEGVKEHELAVFFRNNHFSTLFKHQGALYMLVTDQGYLIEPDVTWEKLDAIDGDTHFYTGVFEPFVPHRAIADMSIGDYVVEDEVDTAMDLQLAMQLQEQEQRDYEAARHRQQLQASPRQQREQQQQLQPAQQQWSHQPGHWVAEQPARQQQQPTQQRQHALDPAELAGLPEELLEEDRLAREMLAQQRQQQQQWQQQPQVGYSQQPAAAGRPQGSPRAQQQQQQQEQQRRAAAPPARAVFSRASARPGPSEESKCAIM